MTKKLHKKENVNVVNTTGFPSNKLKFPDIIIIFVIKNKYFY